MYILLDNFRSLTQINASVTAGRPGGVAGGGGGPAEAPLQSLGRRGHAGGKLYKIHLTRKTASTALLYKILGESFPWYIMFVSSSIAEVAPCLGLRLCTPTLSGLTGTDNRWSRQRTCGNTGTNLPRLMWYILWLLCIAPALPCKGWKAQCDCGTNEIVTILEPEIGIKKA